MSSVLRHVSHGGAGDTGAPRPALVNSAVVAGSRAHEIRNAVAIAINAMAPLKGRPTLVVGHRFSGAGLNLGGHRFSGAGLNLVGHRFSGAMRVGNMRVIIG